MDANIRCPNCKQATLNVELFGPHAEYSAQCPVCGPVSGFVIVDFKHAEFDDKVPEAQAS
jgi:hypothetical protein